MAYLDTFKYISFLLGALILAYLGIKFVLYLLGKLFDFIRLKTSYNKPSSFANKVVWVMGASSGIGEETALKFLKHGAKVILTARRTAKLQTLKATAIEQGAKAENILIAAGDCAKAEEVKTMFQDVQQQFGIPDVMVFSTGTGAWRYLSDQSAAEVERGMQAPFFAAALVFREVLPTLLTKKAKQFQILVMQSPIAYFNWPGCTMYCSNRNGLRGLVSALRQDLHGSNVSVVPVCLGETDTGYWDAHPGSRQYVPWISKFIPTYSSFEAAKIVYRTAALLKKKPVFENYQIDFLIWANAFMLGFIAWTNRLFRKPLEY